MPSFAQSIGKRVGIVPPNISVKPFASLTGTAQKRAALYLDRWASIGDVS